MINVNVLNPCMVMGARNPALRGEDAGKLLGFPGLASGSVIDPDLME